MRFAFLLLAPAALYGQAAVEAGLGAARAATTTAPAQNLAKGIAGAFGSLEKAAGAQPASSTTTTETVLVRSPEVTTLAGAIDVISHAEVGMAYDELVRRFGPPSLELAGAEGGRKLTYAGKEGSTQIEVKEDKVASIKLPEPQAGVLTLPGK